MNSSPDSTHIKLTYTRNLADTAPAVPALNASLVVEGDQNTLIPLNEKGNAVYSNLLSLKTSEKYRLTITTSDGAGEILYKYPRSAKWHPLLPMAVRRNLAVYSLSELQF